MSTNTSKSETANEAFSRVIFCADWNRPSAAKVRDKNTIVLGSHDIVRSNVLDQYI